MTSTGVTTRLGLGTLALVLGLSVSACSSSGNSAAKASAGKTPAGAPSVSANAGVSALVPPAIKSKGAVTIAFYNDGAPEDFEQDGKLVGIQVDLADAAAQLMGLKVNPVSVGSFDSLIPGLQAKRYDASFADFGITNERLKVVDFVSEFDLGTSFAVKKGSGKTIKTATDMCGLNVGVLAGSYFLQQVKTLSDQCTAAGNKSITTSAFPAQAAGILAVTNGRVAAYGASTDQVGYAAAQAAANLDLQPFIYAPIPQGVALPKGSALGKPLQAALRQLLTDGTYRKILTKWNLANVTPTSSEKIQLETAAS